jgi:hypothetical protein
MKIRTDIKSGNIVTDATNILQSGVSSVSDFVTTANDQAKSVTQAVTGTTTKAWTWLTGWI